MGKSDQTKQILAEELKRQCRTNPFNRITIGSLCTACRLDRRTFYYHFRDIYDLAAWIYNSSLAEYLPNENALPGIRGLEDALRQMKEDAWFYRRSLEDVSQNALGRHILRHSALANVAALKRLRGMDSLCEEDLFGIEYHCFGALGMIRRWLYHDCQPEPEHMAQMILSVMPEALRPLFISTAEGAVPPSCGKGSNSPEIAKTQGKQKNNA